MKQKMSLRYEILQINPNFSSGELFNYAKLNENFKIACVCLVSTPGKGMETLAIYRLFTLYRSHQSVHHLFTAIYHFYMWSLAIWQDTCLTYKNLVYDLC